jgi:hypothetical protein
MSRRHVAREPGAVASPRALADAVWSLSDRDGPAPPDLLALLEEVLAARERPGAPDRGPDTWVAALLTAAVDAVPGVALGSVAEVSADGAHSWAATLPVAEELDRRGAAWGEGPGAQALRDEAGAGTLTITPLDESAARRWPRWSSRARNAGVGATLSLVLPGGTRRRPVVLALHGPGSMCFGPSTTVTVRTFAAPLALAVQAATRVAALERALESRDVIGQAKGVLMARHGVDDRAAFEQLVAISQHANVRVAEVAARIARCHRERSEGSTSSR